MNKCLGVRISIHMERISLVSSVVQIRENCEFLHTRYFCQVKVYCNVVILYFYFLDYRIFLMVFRTQLDLYRYTGIIKAPYLNNEQSFREKKNVLRFVRF